MTIGNLNTATRINNAEARFIATCVELAGVDADTAARAMAAFKKAKLIKVDAVVGQMIVKTGQVYDRAVILEWAA